MNALFSHIFVRIGWMLVDSLLRPIHSIVFSGWRGYAPWPASLTMMSKTGKASVGLLQWCFRTIPVAILRQFYRLVSRMVTVTCRMLWRDLIGLTSFLGIIAVLSGLYAYQWHFLNSDTLPDALPSRLAVTTQTPPSDNPVLATHDTQQIKLFDVIAFARQSGGLGATEQLSAADAFQRGLVTNVVDQYLLSRAAEQAALQDDPNISAALTAARRRILASAFLNHQVAQQVTQSEVRAFYDRQWQALVQKDEIQLQKIILNSREEATLLSQRVAAGTSFADLAKAYATIQSTTPDEAKPDNTDYISYNQLPPKAADIIYTTPVGAVTAPLKIDQHWYIFKIIARRPALPPAYPEIRDDIEHFLTQKLINDVMLTLRAQASVSYHRPSMADSDKTEAP